MKKLFIYLVIFVIILVVCDLIVGFIGGKLIESAKGGETQRQNYIANVTNEDVLILGSSRAYLHFNPDVFEDTLGMTAYNCGFSGNGIICAYGYFKMITARYYPKILIYEVTPTSDLSTIDNHTYLGYLHYFYDSEGVKSIFWDVDKTEYYKMMSNMYRFNSHFPMLIMDNLHPLRGYHKGYLPAKGEMENEPKPIEKQDHYEYDSLKLYYINRLIEDCIGNTQLIFTVSPWYGNTDDEVFQPIKELSEKYNIPLLNHYTDSSLNYQKNLFRDSAHLNENGANVYSKIIAGEIYKLLMLNELNL